MLFNRGLITRTCTVRKLLWRRITLPKNGARLPNSKHVFKHRFQEVFLVDVAAQVYDPRELSTELRGESSASALHVIELETKRSSRLFPVPFEGPKIVSHTLLFYISHRIIPKSLDANTYPSPSTSNTPARKRARAGKLARGRRSHKRAGNKSARNGGTATSKRRNGGAAKAECARRDINSLYAAKRWQLH